MREDLRAAIGLLVESELIVEIDGTINVFRCSEMAGDDDGKYAVHYEGQTGRDRVFEDLEAAVSYFLELLDEWRGVSAPAGGEAAGPGPGGGAVREADGEAGREPGPAPGGGEAGRDRAWRLDRDGLLPVGRELTDQLIGRVLLEKLNGNASDRKEVIDAVFDFIVTYAGEMHRTLPNAPYAEFDRDGAVQRVHGIAFTIGDCFDARATLRQRIEALPLPVEEMAG